MTQLIIFQPEGNQPHTDNVRASDIATHLAARDQWSDEAQALSDFIHTQDLPASLCGGAFRLVSVNYNEASRCDEYVYQAC